MTLGKVATNPPTRLHMPYTIEVVKGTPMQLQDTAVTADYYPVGTGEHRFIRCVTWHKGAETEMKSYQTITHSEAIYDMNQRLANGAKLLDLNMNEYQGDEYTPMAC